MSCSEASSSSYHRTSREREDVGKHPDFVTISDEGTLDFRPGCNQTAQDLVNSILSPRTWEKYLASWKSWMQFKKAARQRGWCRAEKIMVDFFEHLIASGYSRGKVVGTLAGISFCLQIMEKKDVTKLFIIQQMLTSWRNREMEDTVETESNGDYGELLTPEMLGSVLYATKKVCFDNNESRLFSAVFTLAFYGPFDMEELAARSKDEDGTGLAFKDVILERNSVYCKMQKARSNKSQWVEVKKRDDKFLCPLNRIKKFLEVRPDGGKNFFIHENGTPLTQFQFSRVLSFALEEAGLDSRRFGPHSLCCKT
ncbi:uncharacterized protein LOC122926573 [Bufo gargarizans]|uniref:uncharacterized protein LOC122926573 n=1 Tax=Bufo gargarizans TaxID=30331 RepID=UPI001CF361D5|nr:uncharacterized protein LOC122926573 [Bufo gargarizans]XP_044133918.1 uncharacterized protein LOC122926573 [Bufo gargarizans]XP_044133919.1 uncharacterized protein LOC122926573 [Bufo gargarizans]